MITLSIGDQAREFATRANVSRAKNRLNLLLKEEGSEQVADLGQRVHGDFRAISSIDASLKLYEHYKENTQLVRQRLAEQQRVLDPIQTEAAELSITLLSLTSAVSNNNLATFTSKAMSLFQRTVAGINSRFVGQALFSGTVIDKPPLLTADEIMTEIETVVQSATSTDDIATRISAWFDNNGALATSFKDELTNTAHPNYPNNLQREIPISDDRSVKLTVTADEEAIRNTIAGLAIAAVANMDFYTGSNFDKEDLLRKGAQIMSNNNLGLISIGAKIGQTESIVKLTEVENSSAVSALSTASNDIRGVDHAATITAVQEADTHIKVLHKLTAQLSRLNLAEFLR